jgi:predicted PurR-regulated permease PerM
MVRPQSGLGEDLNLSALIEEQGSSLAKKLLGGTTEVLGGVFSGITFVVIVPFVAFFLLKEGKRITHGLIELVPNEYFELCLNLLHQINGQIGGYIRGLILVTTAVGTLSVGGLLLVGLPYALPVGIVAGLANMIPFLGPLIGILSAAIVALATGGGIGMVWHVLIVFVII